MLAIVMNLPKCPKCQYEMRSEYYQSLRVQMIKSVQDINAKDVVRGISRSMSYEIQLHCEKCKNIWYDGVYRVG